MPVPTVPACLPMTATCLKNRQRVQSREDTAVYVGGEWSTTSKVCLVVTVSTAAIAALYETYKHIKLRVKTNEMWKSMGLSEDTPSVTFAVFQKAYRQTHTDKSAERARQLFTFWTGDEPKDNATLTKQDVIDKMSTLQSLISNESEVKTE